jgi:hypothetical protein
LFEEIQEDELNLAGKLSNIATQLLPILFENNDLWYEYSSGFFDHLIVLMNLFGSGNVFITIYPGILRKSFDIRTIIQSAQREPTETNFLAPDDPSVGKWQLSETPFDFFGQIFSYLENLHRFRDIVVSQNAMIESSRSCVMADKGAMLVRLLCIAADDLQGALFGYDSGNADRLLMER